MIIHTNSRIWKIYEEIKSLDKLLFPLKEILYSNQSV